VGRQETFTPVFVDSTSTILSPSFLSFHAISGTKDRRTRRGADCAADWHPRAAGNAANQFLRLLIRWFRPSISYLSKVANRVEELSDELQIGSQPPVKEKEQQGDKRN
jgi:hypothetical protein